MGEKNCMGRSLVLAEQDPFTRDKNEFQQREPTLDRLFTNSNNKQTNKQTNKQPVVETAKTYWGYVQSLAWFSNLG